MVCERQATRNSCGLRCRDAAQQAVGADRRATALLHAAASGRRPLNRNALDGRYSLLRGASMLFKPAEELVARVRACGEREHDPLLFVDRRCDLDAVQE